MVRSRSRVRVGESRGNYRDEKGGLGKGFRDWRDNFHSIFIGNLNHRVSNTALWEIFNQYGKVRDVFIGKNNSRPTTYAFVRYGMAIEATRAMQYGNLKMVDGRPIRVSKAFKKQQMQNRKTKTLAEKPEGSNYSRVVRDERSYVRVLMEEDQASGKGQAEVSIGAKEANTHNMVFSSKTTKATMEWLERSVIGRLNSFMQPRSVKEALVREGILVDVSVYGGLSVILSLADKEEMEFMTKEYSSIFAT